MRFQSALVPLLAASAVDALPKNVVTLPPVPTTLSLPEIDPCDREFNSGDAKDSAKVWEKVGGDKYLDQLLNNDDEGPKDWSNRMFRDAGVGGSSGGTSYDCTRLGLESCGATAKCDAYDKPQAFFVHVSITNLYSAFNRMHEALQDTAIFDLAKGIDDIIDTFTKFNDDRQSDIIGMLIGAFVGGAALAGPFWKVGSPLTFVVGMLNLVNSMGQPDYKGDLQHALGQMFKDYSDNLEAGVEGFFKGDFSGTDITANKDKTIKLIKDAFSDGKMLDNQMVNDSVDAWIKSTKKAIVCHVPHNSYVYISRLND